MNQKSQQFTGQNMALLMHLETRVTNSTAYVLKILAIFLFWSAAGWFLNKHGMYFEALLTIAANAAMILYTFFATYTQAADQDWLATLKSLPAGAHVETERFVVEQIARDRGQPKAVELGYSILLDFYSHGEFDVYPLPAHRAG